MNKLLEWFIDKNFSTKIFITIVVFATLLSIIIFIGNLLNPENKNITSENNDTQKTSEPVPTDDPTLGTPTPTPTPEPTDIPLKDNPDEEVSINIGNYSRSQVTALTQFVKEAVEAQCMVDYYETFEQRTARLSPYFASDSTPMLESSVNPTILMQTCSSLGSTINGVDPETGNMRVSTFVGGYTVSLVQLDIPKEERVAKTFTQDYNYELIFTDKWVIVIGNI